MEGETEAQRGVLTCPRSHQAVKRQVEMGSQVFLTPKQGLLTTELFRGELMNG